MKEGDQGTRRAGEAKEKEKRTVAPVIQNIRVSIIQGLFPEKSNYSLKKKQAQQMCFIFL
jgi:hypothetical protein